MRGSEPAEGAHAEVQLGDRAEGTWNLPVPDPHDEKRWREDRIQYARGPRPQVQARGQRPEGLPRHQPMSSASGRYSCRTSRNEGANLRRTIKTSEGAAPNEGDPYRVPAGPARLCRRPGLSPRRCGGAAPKQLPGPIVSRRASQSASKRFHPSGSRHRTAGRSGPGSWMGRSG